jgi:multidrug efflux system membrane fusion protein
MAQSSTEETDSHRGATPLEVASDPGAQRATWIASGITLLIVLWMGSGLVLPTAEPASSAAAPTPVPVAVRVDRSEAAPVTLIFEARGQSLPERDTILRAETSGDVAEVFVSLGQTVEAGAEIARLKSDAAEADLVQARQALDAARRDLENAEALLDRGVSTVDRLQQDRTAFTGAQARLAAAEDAVAATLLTAPFAGRIEALGINTGEVVQAGAEVGRIVDNSPLTVSFDVPQQALSRLSSGQSATVTFITGETAEGPVTFVGRSAASATRTFRAEISIPNPDGAIAAGLSARIGIPTDEVPAHFVSPSVVSLDPSGQLGVKTVDDTDTVRFHPIEIVRAEIDGIWVSGLPETVRLITVGQGFVSDGETVRPQMRDTDE